MNRWIVGIAFVIVIGLLGSLLVIVGGLATQGIKVQLAEPICISGPLTVGGALAVEEPIAVTMDVVEIRVPQPVLVELPSETLDVRATVGGGPCPRCGEGVLLPVNWNLLTGEISWRCTSCGHTVP